MPVYKNPPDLKIEETESPELKIVKHYHAQCLAIKTEIYELLGKLHKGLDEKSEEYICRAREAKMELAEVILEGNKVKKSLKGDMDNARDALHEEADNLVKQRAIEQKDFDLLLKRMGELESYLRNERFHDLVKEINALEDKFEKEAIKLVQKRMGSKGL